MSAHAVLAEAVVREGGRMIRAAFGHTEFTFKGRQDYLTETDGAVERVVREMILAQFPDHSVLGEEEGGNAEAADLWIIDPIDGTANFARGIPHCCISLAYLHEGRPQVAAIYDPIHDELFFAERGQGARCNAKPMSVSNVASLDEASVEIGWSLRAPDQYVPIVQAAIAAGCVVRRTGSGALGLAYTAVGRVDAYISAHMNSWDCAAGLLLVEEAGGQVNDYWTQDAILQGNAVLATNALLGEQISRFAQIPLLPRP